MFSNIVKKTLSNLINYTSNRFDYLPKEDELFKSFYSDMQKTPDKIITKPSLFKDFPKLPSEMQKLNYMDKSGLINQEIFVAAPDTEKSLHDTDEKAYVEKTGAISIGSFDMAGIDVRSSLSFAADKPVLEEGESVELLFLPAETNSSENRSTQPKNSLAYDDGVFLSDVGKQIMNHLGAVGLDKDGQEENYVSIETGMVQKENYLKNIYQDADPVVDLDLIAMDYPNTHLTSCKADMIRHEYQIGIRENSLLSGDLEISGNASFKDLQNQDKEKKSITKLNGSKKFSLNASDFIGLKGNQSKESVLPNNLEADQSLPLQTDHNDGGVKELFLQSALKDASNGMTINGHGSEMNPDVNRLLEMRVINQVVKKAIVELREGKTEIKIQIQPKSMGQIKIQLSSENDKMLAKIMTETSYVKDILEQHMNLLIDELHQQGIDIHDVDVFVTNQGQANYHSQSEGQRETEKRTKFPHFFDSLHDEGEDKDKIKYFTTPKSTNENSLNFYA